MRVLLQRVKEAKVEVSESCIGKIGKGLLLLVGFTASDSEKEFQYMVDKIINLRIFEDEAEKMNLSLVDVKGELLIVSQFTLYADCKRGRRPGFDEAAPPAVALEMYKKFVQKMEATGIRVAQGEFGAMMDVHLVNWGPVTIMLDSAILCPA